MKKGWVLVQDIETCNREGGQSSTGQGEWHHGRGLDNQAGKKLCRKLGKSGVVR